MILTVFLFIIGGFIFLGAAEVAFERIGFSGQAFLAILILTLIGSTVNIPLKRYSNVQEVVEFHEAHFYWRTFRIPQHFQRGISTLVTINLGGAIIPSAVSLYLLATHPSIIIYVLVATIFTSVVIHIVARKVRGVGIVTPAFIPPLAAALISILLYQGPESAIIAYFGGTFGALIGADLTNLSGITKLGAPVVSIGGAGTFDGVFLTGIIAVLLVTFL